MKIGPSYLDEQRVESLHEAAVHVDDYFLVSFGKLHPHGSPADISSWETKSGESTFSSTNGSVGGGL